VWGSHAAVCSDTVSLEKLVPLANISNPLQYQVGASVAADDVRRAPIFNDATLKVNEIK
jgi:hypothetical protein